VKVSSRVQTLAV